MLKKKTLAERYTDKDFFEDLLNMDEEKFSSMWAQMANAYRAKFIDYCIEKKEREAKIKEKKLLKNLYGIEKPKEQKVIVLDENLNYTIEKQPLNS